MLRTVHGDFWFSSHLFFPRVLSCCLCAAFFVVALRAFCIYYCVSCVHVFRFFFLCVHIYNLYFIFHGSNSIFLLVISFEMMKFFNHHSGDIVSKSGVVCVVVIEHTIVDNILYCLHLASLFFHWHFSWYFFDHHLV